MIKDITSNILSDISKSLTATEAEPQDPSAPTNDVAPSITGTAKVGETLSCSNGTWTGFPNPSYTYQWKRDTVNITGATSNTYELVEADDQTTVSCTVTATNSEGSDTADATGVAVTADAPSADVAPVLSGTFNVGEEVSVSQGTWSGAPTITYSYQWTRDASNIAGATSASYTLVEADFEADVTCVVTATNFVDSTTSTPTAQSVVADTPVNTVAPVISGTFNVGEELSSNQGTWTGDGSITYGYQWTRDTVNISGATSSTYTLVAADFDTVVGVKVTATNFAGNSTATVTGSSVTADAPAQISDLATESGDTEVVLTWSAPSSELSITDYVIEYKETSSSTWLTFADGTSATTGATVTGLTNDTSYDFRVSAVSAAGTGTVSATSQETPAVSSVSLPTNAEAYYSAAQYTSGQILPNVITPNSGTAASAYDMQLGSTSSAATDDPTYDAVNGRFTLDGGDFFALAGNNPARIASMHKTVNGNAGTIAICFESPRSSTMGVGGTLRSSSPRHGISIFQFSNGSCRLNQDAGTGQSPTLDVALNTPVDTPFVLCFSWDAGGGSVRAWASTTSMTASTGSITFKASATDASVNFGLMARSSDGSNKAINGTEFYTAYFGDHYCTNEEFEQIVAYMEDDTGLDLRP